jgi:peptide/nickel transport system substrate-binding protein
VRPFSRIVCLIVALAWGMASSASTAQDTLRVAVNAFPVSDGDPHRSVSVFATYTWSPVFETLTTFLEDGTLVGELATSWRQIEPTAWEFTLRPDAVFSNGRPLTAQAVASSLAYLATPLGQTTSVARDLDVVASSEVIDDQTIIIRTLEPSAILPRIMTALYIVEPVHWAELGPHDFAQDPVGSGPFTVSDWDQNRITYSTNPLSWRPPKVDGLEILLLPDATTRLTALTTGRIDIATGLGPDDKYAVEGVGGYLHQRNPIDVISLTFVI